MPVVLRYATLTEQAMHYLKYMMLINSYHVLGAAVNTTLIAGLFRAGGDSRFGFVCDTVDMWCYAVPLGFFAAFVLKLPVLWVYFLLCTDEFAKWPWVLKHYRSMKWLNNIREMICLRKLYNKKNPRTVRCYGLGILSTFTWNGHIFLPVDIIACAKTFFNMLFLLPHLYYTTKTMKIQDWYVRERGAIIKNPR